MAENENLEVRIIRNAAKGLRECADALEKLLSELPDAEAAPKKEPTAEKPLALEDVRSVLAEKSRAGHTAEVKALLIKYGAEKLSGIDPKNYQALLSEVEVIGDPGKPQGLVGRGGTVK